MDDGDEKEKQDEKPKDKDGEEKEKEDEEEDEDDDSFFYIERIIQEYSTIKTVLLNNSFPVNIEEL